MEPTMERWDLSSTGWTGDEIRRSYKGVYWGVRVVAPGVHREVVVVNDDVEMVTCSGDVAATYYEERVRDVLNLERLEAEIAAREVLPAARVLEIANAAIPAAKQDFAAWRSSWNRPDELPVSWAVAAAAKATELCDRTGGWPTITILCDLANDKHELSIYLAAYAREFRRCGFDADRD